MSPFQSYYILSPNRPRNIIERIYFILGNIITWSWVGRVTRPNTCCSHRNRNSTEFKIFTTPFSYPMSGRFLGIFKNLYQSGIHKHGIWTRWKQFARKYKLKYSDMHYRQLFLICIYLVWLFNQKHHYSDVCFYFRSVSYIFEHNLSQFWLKLEIKMYSFYVFL